MAKGANNAMLDASLQYLVTTATLQHICTAAPTLGSPPGALSIGSAAPSFGTIADDTSGRQLPMNQISVTPSGTDSVDHIALTDAGGNTIYFTDTSPTAVTSGVDVDVNAWKVNHQDPT